MNEQSGKRVACPVCGVQYPWRGELARKKILCPCGVKFRLPPSPDGAPFILDLPDKPSRPLQQAGNASPAAAQPAEAAESAPAEPRTQPTEPPASPENPELLSPDLGNVPPQDRSPMDLAIEIDTPDDLELQLPAGEDEVRLSDHVPAAAQDGAAEPAAADGDDATYDLELEDDDQNLDERKPEKPAVDRPADGNCPGCAKPLGETAVICLNCGYNLSLGRRVQTAIDADSPDSGGTEQVKAPGHVDPKRLSERDQRKAEAEAEHIAHIKWHDWIFPLIVLALGLGFYILDIGYLAGRAEHYAVQRTEQQIDAYVEARQNGHPYASALRTEIVAPPGFEAVDVNANNPRANQPVANPGLWSTPGVSLYQPKWTVRPIESIFLRRGRVLGEHLVLLVVSLPIALVTYLFIVRLFGLGIENLIPVLLKLVALVVVVNGALACVTTGMLILTEGVEMFSGYVIIAAYCGFFWFFATKMLELEITEVVVFSVINIFLRLFLVEFAETTVGRIFG